MITFGRFKVSLVNFGSFRLDGGAMFGSVPKNLWAKRIAADAENCIPLALRSLKIEGEGRTFLVDVGIGEKWNEKQRAIFAIKNTPQGELGFVPESITDVILTHLHFDHAGGISRCKSGSPSELELVYPKATVHVQKANVENAEHPNVKERASYLNENVEILNQGQLNLLNGETEIVPGLWVHTVHGHTWGQQTVELRDGETSLVFPTDLIPTSHHLPVAFHMGYDICAETILKEKEAFLAKCVERRSIVVFQHDPEIAAGRVVRDERGQFTLGERVTV